MLTVNDISPGSQQPSSTQLQMQLIASVEQASRVSQMNPGEQSSDSGMQNSGGRADPSKLIREAAQKSGQQRALAEQNRREPAQTSAEADTRSIIEAQEDSETASTLTAAFQARYSINDLLSVIRDPEDQMLPAAPSKDNEQ